MSLETPMMSPSVKDMPQEVGSLNFYDAIKEIVNGKKVTKLEWANDDYVFMKAEILHIHRDGADHRWIISEADIVGEDYVLLPEEVINE
jgi:hypothetical protein